MSSELIDKYNAFSHEVSHDFRYSLSSNSIEFLDEVIEKADKYTKTIPAGTEFYRARMNNLASDNEISTIPFDLKEMKPILNVVSEGRANAGNICALYLADNVGTDLSEVRAGTNHPVTVGKFLTTKDLKILDISLQMGWWHYFNTPRSERFWFVLSYDFSRPLGAHNQHVHYAKTQIIAEHFKRHGFDGISYRSQFITYEKTTNSDAVEGKNYVLFDLSSADAVQANVYKVIEQRIVFDAIEQK